VDDGREDWHDDDDWGDDEPPAVSHAISNPDAVPAPWRPTRKRRTRPELLDDVAFLWSTGDFADDFELAARLGMKTDTLQNALRRAAKKAKVAAEAA
jgi:hypothetical protein